MGEMEEKVQKGRGRRADRGLADHRKHLELTPSEESQEGFEQRRDVT